MTVLSPVACPNTSVQRGNAWAQTITLPATDTGGNPLTWGTFTVDSPQTTLIAIAVSGTPPVVVLSLTGTQTAALTGYVHWYLTETTVMGGNRFLTGRITLVAEQ